MPARWFLGLAILATASTAWSTVPQVSLVQGIGLTVLALICLFSSQGRWRTFEGVQADLRGLYWPLWWGVLVSVLLQNPVSGRWTGIFTNANTLGNLSALVLILGLTPWVRPKNPFFAIASLVALLGVLTSESRTALLVVIVAAVSLLFRKLNPTHVLLFSVAAFTILALRILGLQVPVPAAWTRLRPNVDDDLLNSRDEGWRLALDIWAQDPIGGIGYRAGESAFAAARATGSQFMLDGAHSSYFQLLAELGLSGVALGVCLVASVMVSIIRALRLNRACGTLVLVPIAGLMMAFTESFLFAVGQPLAWIFWIVAIIISAYVMPREGGGQVAEL